MKIVFTLSVLALAVTPVLAQKPCEELKSEIAAKLDARGVQNYQLDIVLAADVKDATVVGSCELGSKKVTYSKAPSAKASTPPNHSTSNHK